jgi:hypothetical protein
MPKDTGHIIDAPNSDNDNLQFNADFSASTTPGEGAVRPNMAKVRAQEDSAADEADEFVPCTKEQLDDIEFLKSDKCLDKTRQLKALDHFSVNSFAELTFKQAEEMIKILNKLE